MKFQVALLIAVSTLLASVATANKLDKWNKISDVEKCFRDKVIKKISKDDYVQRSKLSDIAEDAFDDALDYAQDKFDKYRNGVKKREWQIAVLIGNFKGFRDGKKYKEKICDGYDKLSDKIYKDFDSGKDDSCEEFIQYATEKLFKCYRDNEGVDCAWKGVRNALERGYMYQQGPPDKC